MKITINRYLYTGFILFGLYLFFLRKNFGDAMIYLGIALAFDPFDVNQKWKERPKWQKWILVFHLVLVFLLFLHELWTEIKPRFMDGFLGK